jgi:hypothetical protein
MRTKFHFRFIALALLAFTCFSARLSTASAQGTAFTFNGKLNDGANPANGSYDLRFTLYNAVTNGGAAGVLTNVANGITNGLFEVTLDFGAVFNGTNYWIELAARTNGAGVFTVLSPRQPVLPAPYAIYSASAGSALLATSAGSVAATNISGTIPLGQLPPVILTNNENNVLFNGAVTATNLVTSASQNFVLQAGNGNGNGGSVSIQSGNAGIASGGAGGNLNLQAGNAMVVGGSGYSGLGAAGAVTITAGQGYNSTGGNVTIVSGGNSPWNLTANSYSKVSLLGGNINTGDGAELDVEGGHNTQYGSPPQYSAGGNVRLVGGSATGSYSGGNVLLLPGAGTPNGNVGVGKTNPTTALDVNGTVTATSFSGNGGGLTGINASQLTGALTLAQLPAAVVTSSSGALMAQLITNLAVPSYSYSVSVNPGLNKIYLAGGASSAQPIVIVDGAAFTQTTAGNGMGAGVDVTNNNYWSGGVYADNVTVWNSGNAALASEPTGSGCTYEVSVDAPHRRVWAGAQCSDSIWAFNADTYALISGPISPGGVMGPLFVNPVNDRLYFNAGGSSRRVNPNTFGVTANSFGTVLGVNVLNNQLYAQGSGNGLQIINGAPDPEVVLTNVTLPYAVPGYFIGVNPVFNEIYVQQNTNTFAILDGTSGAALGTVNLGAGITTVGNITVDASRNRVYVVAYAGSSPSLYVYQISPSTVVAGSFTGSGAGLTNIPANAITGGVTTNLLVGGHTLYITNGIIMSVQ